MAKNSLPKHFTVQDFIFIAIGAIPGALIRFHLGDYFLANILGSHVLGICLGLSLPWKFQMLIGFGFCGALTTFSSWIISTFELIVIGQWVQAFISISQTLVLGLLAGLLGLYFGKRLSLSRHFQ